MSDVRTTTPVHRLAAAVCVAGLLVPALAARAFVPNPNRVAIAIARANIKADRDQSLRFQVAVRIGDGPVVAQGELETQPSGLARLELRGAKGLRERHLLHSGGHTAGRNGERLDEPRAMLPPIFLLQADSMRSVMSSLESFGIDPMLVGLAPCGEENCYVIGDPTRVAAPASAQLETGPSGAFGSFWVEKESFEARRMRSSGGTRVEFGRGADFGKIRAPAWFEVREPGRDPVRFEIQGVSASRLSPAEFSVEWVLESQAP